MTRFNQDGQTIYGPQTNIGGDVGRLSVTLGVDTNRAALVGALEGLKSELARMAERGEIDADVATNAEYRVSQARNEAKKSNPDNGRILALLVDARELLKTVASAAGLVAALNELAGTIRQFL